MSRKTDTGIRSIVFEKQLFQVSLVQLASGFMIYFSMDHVLGDGHSFYSLFKMLDPKEKVFSLDCNRKLDFNKDLPKVYGRIDDRYFDYDAIKTSTLTLRARTIKL
jgi:hypothetical protein